MERPNCIQIITDWSDRIAYRSKKLRTTSVIGLVIEPINESVIGLVIGPTNELVIGLVIEPITESVIGLVIGLVIELPRIPAGYTKNA